MYEDGTQNYDPEIHKKYLVYVIHHFVSLSHVQTIQSGPEKNAQSLMHHHSATVCSRITRFPPKCSGKIIVCQSMHNVYQLVKSLLNSQNLIHNVSDVTLHVNIKL